ncbi:MAG: DUF4982 domain-containing protein [Muribaculum sp.]|nr:DUF4982 domain-containing protein [Muribaculaceae bacterium]MCM1080833.1 DUF4982 domain-containing protein [Muribaculum sp.]
MRLKRSFIAFICVLCACSMSSARRNVATLNDGWQFTKEGGEWQHVRVPHDWAIYGPFDRNNDLQTVAVKQNGETKASEKTGRTGGLPFIGKGYYKTTFNVADTTGRSTTLVFDGAMSNAHVRVNGKEVIYWPYGYNSFYVGVDSVVKPGENTLEVDLENYERASRWYSGAGLFRNVHVVNTNRIHIPTWGTFVTTPYVSDEYASVSLKTEITGMKKGEKVTVATTIFSPDNNPVASSSKMYVNHNQGMTQNLIIDNPELWSPESPALYHAVTNVITASGDTVDTYTTRFGVRDIKYIPEKGFFLNGKMTKFKGVCNHHDLGPLGAAVNRSAIRHQIKLLKDMGANAIRTSHNMPAPELVELCEEMGMMLMIEPFDDWGFRPKSPNGYGRFFKEWAERDVSNMVKHYRNSPALVIWSIGNEVPSQWGPDGVGELSMLQDIVHRLDPTRPATCGMDQIRSVLDNGFAASLDIPGFNYKPQFYDRIHDKLPQQMLICTESASTVSSRGVYHFPVKWNEHNVVISPDHQSSSYDNETCSWSNTPDIDMAMDDDHSWVLGQFVWTGFDYLGEPSPYDTDAWPNHSSVFGIIDLASLPKDRFYLYRSKWNQQDTTLHVLPHWTWPERKGQITPIFVYTSLQKAELFINGKSQGVREKNDSTYQNRYRLMWNDVVYTPGEIRVVAYDSNNQPVAEKIVRTAGKPHHLVITPNRTVAKADGDDLVYFTVTVADRDGNPVPSDSRMVKFDVSGQGTFEATANGDPICLLPFQNPEMQLFSGAATVIVRPSTEAGQVTLRATAKGVKPASATITTL